MTLRKKAFLSQIGNNSVRIIMAEICRAHIFISGKVQGVYFRSHVASLAKSYGLRGWVRNLADGRVETMLEGNKEIVEKVIEFCKNGPPNASVTDVQINWEKPKNKGGDFATDFKIIF